MSDRIQPSLSRKQPLTLNEIVAIIEADEHATNDQLAWANSVREWERRKKLEGGAE